MARSLSLSSAPASTEVSVVDATSRGSAVGLAISIGFAIASCVWFVAFCARTNELVGLINGQTLATMLVAVMFMGATWTGWRRGIKAAVVAMIVCGAVNTLLVLSVANDAGVAVYEPDRVQSQVWTWVPANLVLSAAIGLIGGAIGSVLPGSRRVSPAHASATAGPALLGFVAVITTLVLISIGGLVTSLEAGLAVPDWPTSYDYNMFLFPLSRMVGGAFYEHAHRLVGSLVGLQTMVLFAWLWRRTLRRYALHGTIAFVLVCVQGGLGGGRVQLVERFGHDATLAIAVVHACTAQVYLLILFALAWRLKVAGRSVTDSPTTDLVGVRSVAAFGPVERWTGILLVAATLLQTLLGALVRQFSFDLALLGHLGGAVLVVLLGLGFATMILGGPESRLRQWLAFALMAVICLQIGLGGTAWWITTRFDSVDQVTSSGMTLVTAGHVVVGALVLLAGWYLTLEVFACRRSRDAAVPSTVAATTASKEIA